jgi:hypothetical protein
MFQQVLAQEAKLVLRAENPHRDPAEAHPVDSPVRLSRVAVVERAETHVEIHGTALVQEVSHRARGGRMLPGSDEEVDVAVGAKAGFRVEPSDHPALGQERLHAGRAERREGLEELLLVECGEQCLMAIRLHEPGSRRSRLQRRLADPPPAEAPAACPEQQRHDIGEFVRRERGGGW